MEHLSYSSISTYLLCPRSWAFKYRDCVPVATSPALALGSAFHGAIEALIRAPFEGKQMQPTEAWREAWGKATQQTIAWDDRQTPESVSNDGLRMLLASDTLSTVQNLRPLVIEGQPVIEKRIELRVPGVPIPVIGFIDLIGDDGVAYDLKTAARAWTQEQAEKEVQPLFYLAALNQEGWTPNVSYRFRHVVFTKTKTPQVQIIETQRQSRELLWLAGLIAEVWHGIEAEVFPPNPGAWLCGQRYCAFWAMCKGR